ncbi:MAG TPA: BBP7 family outer membrane beta-barrel protein [Gemmataceae bacterium]|nr:BBP7 family outer membrane beta-barrel protein [Gemmataceae bacterium]
MKRILAGLFGLVLVIPVQAQVVDGAGAAAPAAGPVSAPAGVSSTDGAMWRDPTPNSSALWIDAEYLLWWIKDGHVPPLVTTGNPLLGNPNAPTGVPGALGQPLTTPLFGSPLDYGRDNGMRFTLGTWLGADSALGVEASGFVMENRPIGFATVSNVVGNPVIYVPFFNAVTGKEGSLTVAEELEGISGQVSVRSESQLWGAEGNGLYRLGDPGPLTLGLLLGFRYLDLRESLDMAAQSTDFEFNIQYAYNEGFHTRNQFYGGQTGLRVGYHQGAVSLDVTGKVALGNTHEVLTISGVNTVSGAGAGPAAGTFPGGGVFVQPSNLGVQSHDAFAVVPQIQAKLGWNATNWLRTTIGYDFLYWSDVIRPGDQIDRVVNPTQAFGGTLVGPARPMPLFNHTGFIAHGVSFGLELTF